MWPFKTKIVEVEKIVEKEVVKYVDRVVVGPPIAVKIYVAKTKNTERFAGLGSYVTEELHGYFLSCEEAFRAFPGKNVEEKDGLFIGGEYFLSSHAMNRVEVTKPRVAKGKK